ncbi:MAG: hypothetical protein AB2A00_19885 [Myxococcota bacterium]
MINVVIHEYLEATEPGADGIVAALQGANDALALMVERERQASDELAAWLGAGPLPM